MTIRIAVPPVGQGLEGVAAWQIAIEVQEADNKGH
jgi:hypothetical protein